ncbi:MAG: hypothetical protein ACXWFB_11690 [Nitrososphaeraceae archaeon]
MDKPKKSRLPSNNINKSIVSLVLLIKSLRPSLISGAADNDPSAITNYSHAGAEFGFILPIE